MTNERKFELSIKSVSASKRSTYQNRAPKAWAVLSIVLIGAAFGVMAFRIVSDAYMFDGLFLLGFLFFATGLVCALLQMEATERWKQRS